MQIDWLTVVAQIVNFLVLVWLLQRFLYGPITRAMARREERIEERLADARETRQNAEKEAQTLRRKQRELEGRKDQFLGIAQREAGETRDRLEEEMHVEIAEKRRAWRVRIGEESEEFLKVLRKRTSRHVFQTVRSVLAEFADADLAGQVAAQFIDHLRALDEDQHSKLAEAAARTGEDALIESGVELPSATRGRITRALHELISDEIDVQYRTDGDILLGVRLTVGEQTAEWSASKHLDQLESIVAEALEKDTAPMEPEAA